jgi:uncharacterized protein
MRLFAGTSRTYDPNRINQIGCVCTAQGFEFDYAAVIFGNELTYNFDQQTWKGHPENSADNVVKRSQNNFTDLIKTPTEYYYHAE